MLRLAFAAACFVFASIAYAEDAPLFRGAGGTGVSSEKNLPTTWSDKENVRWKAPLPGKGLSCPIIVGDRVFVTACTTVHQNRLHVLCFDAKSGKQLWERQFWATGGTQCHPKTNMAAPTPVSDGKRVIALFATADIFCLDLEGNLEWVRSLVGDYPTIGNNVGMAASPTVHGETLIVQMENVGESFAVGIDTVNGKNRWRHDRPRIINWATPIVVRSGKVAAVVLQTPSELTAHDVVTGKQLWSFTQTRPSTIPSATAGDGMLFVPGDKLAALKLRGDEDPEPLWMSNKLPSGYSSPTYYQGRVYAVSGRGVVNAADAKTGKIEWTHRIDANISSSPLIADGRMYITAEDGQTTVLELGNEAKVLAVNPLGETILACPVAAQGAIFLRSDKHLWCIAK
ncbi:MAG: PQQ-binding-like beta-propeller repeat protein [Gemmataceae bacterium]